MERAGKKVLDDQLGYEPGETNERPSIRQRPTAKIMRPRP
jgi:hypothetical protein